MGTTVDLNNALLEDSEFIYTYDYNDNLIQRVKKSNQEVTTYTYDYENRLTRVQYPGMDAQYLYDALGRRIQKNVNGQVTTCVYDGLNMVSGLQWSLDGPLQICLWTGYRCTPLYRPGRKSILLPRRRPG